MLGQDEWSAGGVHHAPGGVSSRRLKHGKVTGCGDEGRVGRAPLRLVLPARHLAAERSVVAKPPTHAGAANRKRVGREKMKYGVHNRSAYHTKCGSAPFLLREGRCGGCGLALPLPLSPAAWAALPAPSLLLLPDACGGPGRHSNTLMPWAFTPLALAGFLVSRRTDCTPRSLRISAATP